MTHTQFTGVLVVLATTVAVGCANRAPQPVAQAQPPTHSVAEVAPPPAPPPSPPSRVPPPTAALSEEEIFARKTLERLNAERPLADVFFDYDESVLREDARIALQKNAEWLRRWPSTKITIEGHSDERGTTEYNLSLGERRASAAREYLISLGVSPQRMLAVTKGEESPFCAQSYESCWHQNRRAHYVITVK